MGSMESGSMYTVRRRLGAGEKPAQMLEMKVRRVIFIGGNGVVFGWI